jgi:aminoglycoside phosphotransferase (APT) family kinase protein
MTPRDDSADDYPSDEAVRRLLAILVPENAGFAISSLEGSYSNLTHLVEATSAAGTRTRIVIRRYVQFGAYDRAEKARREYRTYELLRRHGIPAPNPLYLDAHGTLLGSPGIVTDYVVGEHITRPSDAAEWARSLARMLARIHAIPCDSEAKGFLLDANAEALWFVRSGLIPDFMAAQPDGAEVWQAVHDMLPDFHSAGATLVHIDYWPGNILWHRGRITAVVDWEEAAYGDPTIDVAYCRMEMFLRGNGDAADEFLHTYEAETGQRVANLAFWELAATARPTFAPEGWITEEPVKQRFREFTAKARKRAGFPAPPS